MENMHSFTKSNNLNSEYGAILIIALLFLMVLTLLIMGIMRISILETKMSRNYRDKIFSLEQAEINLYKKENLIKNFEKLPSKVVEISHAICGVTFYRVQAIGKYHGSKSVIESTYAIVRNISSCKSKPKIKEGRQSWRMVQ